ncbi:MAG: VOC family protein [Thermoanaerobaculia bacterium]
MKNTTKKAPAKKVPSRKAKSAPAKARAAAEASKMCSVSASFTVNDVEKSLAWYRDVLGFAVEERWERDGKLLGVELRAGGVSVMLGQDDWKKERDRKKGEGFRIYILCDAPRDVDALAKRIESHGGTLEHPPRNEPWGMRDVSLTDPDGFKLTICAETKKR